VTLPKESDLQEKQVSLIDQTEFQDSKKHDLMKDKVTPPITPLKHFPHLSLNPISGNSLY
jgi:hypothetical protein